MLLNNDKQSNSLDILYGLSNDDIFGSSSIYNIQKYDKYSSSEYIYNGENRPDLNSSINQYGYLLFANPSNKWVIGNTYQYYPDEVIIRSKADEIFQL